MRFINDATWKYQFPLLADPETLRATMEELILLILLVIGGLVVILPITALVFARKARRQADELGKQVGFLREQQARTIEREARLIQRIELLETVNKMPQTPLEPVAMESQAKYAPPPVASREFISAPAPKLVSEPASQASAPPPVPQPEPVAAKTPEPVRPPGFSLPLEAKPRPTQPSSLNLEQFMGAKLFAWVGGLALFLGVIFFVKLSIERGWISPELRTAI
ncbi:MAG: DUF2339 domain-containing protein, partial [Prosthecobacter sp.]|nr:DUF2339 domain-containing protein [Prosthecobacter sp.]